MDGGPTAAAGPEVSVCIATRGRPDLLDACLASLQAQRDPPAFELLVCCQGDSAGAPVVRARFPDAVVGRVGQAFPGGARNFLVERARGEWLVFLDDDVVCAPDLLARLVALAGEHPDEDVFGGPNLTPPGSSRFQMVQGAALASLVGSGPVRRRYGRHRAASADERRFTLCNLAVRRSRMPAFPPELRGGEENAILSQLAAQGTGMRYDPGLWVYHERRARYRPFATQMLKYGRGRGQVFVRDPGRASPLYLWALAFLAAGLATVAVALAVTPWVWLVVAAYAGALTLGGLVIAWPLHRRSLVDRMAVVAVAVGLFATMHACYSAGVVWGLCRRRTTPASMWEDLPAGPAEVTVAPPGPPAPAPTLASSPTLDAVS